MTTPKHHDTEETPMPVEPPELTLAPIPYFWPRDAVVSFYRAVAEWPVDTVYLGETVCSKRRRVTPADWIAMGESLAAAGKRVVLASLTLIEAGSELGALQRLAAESPFPIEANDMGAVGVMERLGKPFVAGPTTNPYNTRALRRLRDAGAVRWVLPVELGAPTAAALARALPELPMEVLAWGRLPLAWSARCFSARAENRPRDDCGFVCGNDPDGRLVCTRDGRPFLNINGVHTESARTHNLAADYGMLRRSGARALRIVPQPRGTGAVVEAFDALRTGADPAAVAERLEPLAPVSTCNGFWHQRHGGARVGLPPTPDCATEPPAPPVAN